jgi:hypothetical protein
MDLKIVQAAFVHELDKIAADLTAEARERGKTAGLESAVNPALKTLREASQARHGQFMADLAKEGPALVARKTQEAVRRFKTGSIDPQLFKSATFNLKDALTAVREEGLPALGATLGAGVAKGFGRPALTGAAIGYGLGAVPEILRGHGGEAAEAAAPKK